MYFKSVAVDLYCGVPLLCFLHCGTGIADRPQKTVLQSIARGKNFDGIGLTTEEWASVKGEQFLDRRDSYSAGAASQFVENRFERVHVPPDVFWV